MAKATGAIRTGGMAALMLAWAELGEGVLGLGVVLPALLVTHHVIAVGDRLRGLRSY